MGRQSLLLVLWNTSARAEALALYKTGSWLSKLQRSREQLGKEGKAFIYCSPWQWLYHFLLPSTWQVDTIVSAVVQQQNWISWFRWNENWWGVNSKVLLLWRLQLTYFLSLLFFLENNSLFSTRTLEGELKHNWFQLDWSVIKACPSPESRVAPPLPESLIKAEKAGDNTVTDSCGLELCCHRIVTRVWNSSCHFKIALNSCLETLIGELIQNWLIKNYSTSLSELRQELKQEQVMVILI